MQKLQFTINIEAPVSNVYDIMLGITEKGTYEKWTATFNPTSTYEGQWTEGTKILFLGVDENGQKGGMVSRIKELTENEFVSIEHYGLLQGDQEITEGPEVEKWANGFENYTFKDSNGTTTITVDLDTTEDFVEFMQETYPVALQILKGLCEK